MSDAPDDTPVAEPSAAPATAGALLKQARLAKGLHIAALATSIKVAPRKLELLEADKYDELPGATFTRALAQTVCRSLKIDSAPVLALLPQPADQGLSQLSRGLNEPFRDKPGRRVPSDLNFIRSPIAIAAAVLVAASAVLYLLPAGWVADLTQKAGSASRDTEPAPVSEMASSSSVVTLPLPAVADAASEAAVPLPPAASAPVEIAPAASVPAASAVQPAASTIPGGALLLRAQAQSWIEVIDGRGNPLMSRLLEAGETVGLDGPTPLRVRIGNAAGTQVSFRGRPVELAPSRDNVAKLELR